MVSAESPAHAESFTGASSSTGCTQCCPIVSSHVGPSTRPSCSCRCTQCLSSNAQSNPKELETERNLVVCIDGTSNEFGQNNTNVVKLYAKIKDLPNQEAYYSSGIGTRPKSLNVFDRAGRAISDGLDMAIAWNVEEIVKDAYGWLARTYKEGNRIYLFGFSRGAYQVRVLAAMIHEVGLIRAPTDKQIGTAYDHYSATRSKEIGKRQIAREFKNTFSRKDVRVHFVGVWDTVSSVGLIKVDEQLSASSSAAHACYFRHALALDELRVKFMPEYFQEMKCDRMYNAVHNDHAVTEQGGNERSATIKEVWFAGSHSDVGGKTRPGEPYHAGNVSLLWMRREAAECGLVLDPTDVVWVPDDLDSGTTKSMNFGWKIAECLPIKHQVSFRSAGSYAYRFHLSRPRHIIPGQKVHASVLYANTYKPLASPGKEFDMPIIHANCDSTELDGELWETGLFDDTAAQQLITNLGRGQQEVAPIYLDRLLFMLRFEEGRKSVRKVPDSQLLDLICKDDYTLLVRLVAIIAYYEAGFSDAKLNSKLPPNILAEAKQSLFTILNERKHRDRPRVVPLLRPLARHQILREQFLTTDMVEVLVKFFDTMIIQDKWSYVQAMDGLSCLLGHEDTQEIIIEKLGIHSEALRLPSLIRVLDSRSTRLSRILAVSDPFRLTAALHMVMALARLARQISEAGELCSTVKHRIRELATKDKQLVGPLAVEILLVLYDPMEQDQLDIRNSHVRANLADVLARLYSDRHDSDRHNLTSADGRPQDTNPGQEILNQIFGLNATTLKKKQKKLIRELKSAVQNGKYRERTAATLTLVKLCDTKIIRTYFLRIKLLDVFVGQLQKKDSALLAAYALAVCLKYLEMKDSVDLNDNKLLSRNIVYMLMHNCFDNTVASVEGFQIFGDLMKHEELRKNVHKDGITTVLSKKLAKNKPNETRASLIYLDIFRSYDEGNIWTEELVSTGLEWLRKPAWKDQKAGVAVLFALSRTERGRATVSDKVIEIIEMLLPKGQNSEPVPLVSADGPPRRPSSMLGPACTLRLLAQNETLQERVRKTVQYGRLKYLFMSGKLVNGTDTPAAHVRTPNRADVNDMLDKMIKAVDGELSEKGLLSMEDSVLPHISHWNRLLRESALIITLPGLLGVSMFAVLAAIVSVAYVVVTVPVVFIMSVALSPTLFLSVGAYQICSRFAKRAMRRGDDDDDDDDAPNGHDSERPSSGDMGLGGEQN